MHLWTVHAHSSSYPSTGMNGMNLKRFSTPNLPYWSELKQFSRHWWHTCKHRLWEYRLVRLVETGNGLSNNCHASATFSVRLISGNIYEIWKWSCYLFQKCTLKTCTLKTCNRKNAAAGAIWLRRNDDILPSLALSSWPSPQHTKLFSPIYKLFSPIYK